MSTQTEFHSLLETSFGYTGVNIKIPITSDIRQMRLKKFDFIKDNDVPTECFITYDDYLQLLPEKEQLKKINKERFNNGFGRPVSRFGLFLGLSDILRKSCIRGT
jgi:hypothetical protein